MHSCKGVADACARDSSTGRMAADRRLHCMRLIGKCYKGGVGLCFVQCKEKDGNCSTLAPSPCQVSREGVCPCCLLLPTC